MVIRMLIMHSISTSGKADIMTRKQNLKATFAKDGKEYHEGFLIRRIKTTAGIRFQADLGKHGRPSFKTKDLARGCAAQRRLEIEKNGIAAKSLPQKQRVDAIEAMAVLGSFDANLLEAANFYAKHHTKVDRRNGVGHLIEAYIKERAERVETGDLRPRTYEDTIKRLKPLKAQLGHLAIDAVSDDDLKRMLNEFQQINKANYKRYTSMFFRWAVKKGHVQTNPVDQLDSIRIADQSPAIYTPKQVEAILEACTQASGEKKARTEMLPYFTMAFFAGIRPDELRRLDWKSIDLEDGVINISTEVSKTNRSRHFLMPKNLQQWLATFPNREGLIFPWSETSLKRWRAEVYKLADVPSLQDGARHSMATYHLALHTVQETTDLLGHSDQVLFRHYNGMIIGKKTKAKAYFNIVPQSASDKIIPLQSAKSA